MMRLCSYYVMIVLCPVTLPGFLLPSAISSTVSDISASLSSAWYTKTVHNVFQAAGDERYDRDPGTDKHLKNLRNSNRIFN